MAGKITDLTDIPSVNRSTNRLEIVDVSGNASYKVSPNNLLGITGNPVGDTDSQTLTAKTLTNPTINGATLSGTLAGTYTLGGTPTFPASVVTLTGSQTLTNKTLTAPTISSPTITNASITADAITGFTTGNSGTIYGIPVTSSQIGTSALTNGSVTPAKLATHVSVGTFSAPGSTGNFSISSLVFTPVLVRFTMLEVTNTTDAVNSSGAMTALFQYTNVNHVSSGSFNSYSSTVNCLSYTPFNSATPVTLASFVSMNSNGFTINFSAISGGGTFAWEAWG